MSRRWSRPTIIRDSKFSRSLNCGFYETDRYEERGEPYGTQPAKKKSLHDGFTQKNVVPQIEALERSNGAIGQRREARSEVPFKPIRGSDVPSSISSSTTRHISEGQRKVTEGVSLSGMIEIAAKSCQNVSSESLSMKYVLGKLSEMDTSSGIDSIQLSSDLEQRHLTTNEALLGMGLFVSKLCTEMVRTKEELEHLKGTFGQLQSDFELLKKEKQKLVLQHTDEDGSVFGLFCIDWLEKLGPNLMCRCEGKNYLQIDLLGEARDFVRPRAFGTARAQQFLIHLLTSVLSESVLGTYTTARYRNKYETVPEDIQLCVRKAYFAAYGILQQDDLNITGLDPSMSNIYENYDVLNAFYYSKLESLLRSCRRKRKVADVKENSGHHENTEVVASRLKEFL